MLPGLMCLPVATFVTKPAWPTFSALVASSFVPAFNAFGRPAPADRFFVAMAMTSYTHERLRRKKLFPRERQRLHARAANQQSGGAACSEKGRFGFG
jgi:hypothetical protein